MTVPERGMVACVVIVVADGDVEDDPLEQLATDLLWGKPTFTENVDFVKEHGVLKYPDGTACAAGGVCRHKFCEAN